MNRGMTMNNGISYEVEDLVPIVAELAKRYTSGESSSISYEAAGQLMEAVLYCIREFEKGEAFSLTTGKNLPARRCYERGLELVEKKVQDALKLYNRMMLYFSSYGNRCLQDTVEKGMPEFFKWYDYRLNPQNTLLTLDYPILMDLSANTGIDRVYGYLLCIQLEQKFLRKIPRDFVIGALSEYDSRYQWMIDNLCEVVLFKVIRYIILDKNLTESDFSAEELSNLQKIVREKSLEELREMLREIVDELVDEYFEKDDTMKTYLYAAIQNISVRMEGMEDETMKV